MIAKVFKNRNRNQIKNKFLREEKLAPEKVNGTFNQPKSSSFQTIFKKFEKLKKIQQNKNTEETKESADNKENKGLNLLMPFQRPQQSQGIKQEELNINFRERNGRSGSFHSTASIDSVDRAIMEDLSDILIPQKGLFC